jgi:hypothetical protein
MRLMNSGIALISASEARPSLFGSSLDQMRSFHPTLSGTYWVGQSGADYQKQARQAVIDFNALLDRIATISSDSERSKLLQIVGTASQEDSPAQRFALLFKSLSPNADAYNNVEVQAKIRRLQDSVTQIDSMVTNSENSYGKLSVPVAIDKAAILTLPGEGGMHLSTMLLVAGTALAMAIGVSYAFGVRF